MGGKARGLSQLRDLGYPVPRFFVIAAPPQAVRTELNGEQLSAFLQEQMTLSVQTAIEEGLRSLAATTAISAAQTPVRFAVRSSATEEDGEHLSFAGQLDSFLNVPAEKVQEHVILVWQSALNDRIMSYRKEHDLQDEILLPAVIVQEMINPEVSGVIFTVDPVSANRNRCAISTVYGLGHGLVSGELDADYFGVSRDGVVETKLANKTEQYVSDDTEGLRLEQVPAEKASQPTLNRDQLLHLANLSWQIEQDFGSPQDIEFAFSGGVLFILQSRPITTLGETDVGHIHSAIRLSYLPQVKQNSEQNESVKTIRLWDNSNIAESYNGVTTPLTFSFASHAYQEVYLGFCRLMGVPESKIKDNSEIFPHMLGLIQGRIYYNLLNWYRLLSLLPGYSLNKKFMEQMMGVKESVPEELLPGNQVVSLQEKAKDVIALVGTIYGLICNYFTLPTSIKQFYNRLRVDLQKRDLSALSTDELVRYYRQLQRSLLSKWDAPLVNDFFAMIFYGALRALCNKWCNDTDESLQNSLIAVEGDIISADPARRIIEMAKLVATNGDLYSQIDDAIQEQNPARTAKFLERARIEFPQFGKLLDEYLNLYGDRCLEELKLESTTLHDDPALLLQSIARLTQQITERNDAPESTTNVSIAVEMRGQGEEKATAALGRAPFKRAVFDWVLANARARVRDRENLRFERTRVFGRVRRIFLEIGKRFQDRGLLQNHRDIFYLEVDEILGYLEGTSTCTDLQALVDVRQKEFDRFAMLPEPPTRIKTEGLVYSPNTDVRTSASDVRATPCVAPESGTLKGIPCCPGIVRGRVRVISNPKNATISKGEILVAKRTDPGWIMLFPAAAGLLVEHGSLLSHSAIVARELGLPAIVSVTGITTALQDGDLVEFDGATGQIQVIERQLSPANSTNSNAA